MKTLFFILLSVLVIPSCDDSSSNINYNTVCEDMCNREDECDLLGGDTLEECIAECEDFAVNMLDDFVTGVSVCTTEKTCEELAMGDEVRDVCYDENLDSCTTDVDSYIETACLKILECNGNTEPTSSELETCEGQMHGDGNIFICFKQSVIDSVEDCIANSAECTPNPVNECVEDILGIDMGSSSTNNQTR
ncbi:MAG: hypothetical protein JXR95_09075 [Deltaproteobacteria bacterium]|nr:hypothetical protein [Deltaproteobacteria bacterium]